jgi:hypothetical protein
LFRSHLSEGKAKQKSGFADGLHMLSLAKFDSRESVIQEETVHESSTLSTSKKVTQAFHTLSSLLVHVICRMALLQEVQ